jgi:cholestenol delta-isomerase
MVALTPMLLLTLGSAALAWRLGRERLLSFWLLWSGLIHIVMEASYGLFHQIVKARATTTFTEFLFSRAPLLSWFDPHWWASVYGQYARYDGRYAVNDPLVIYVCYTEMVLGPLCFLLLWLVQRRSPMRHRVQILLCTAQFYGTVLYFVMPVVQGTWGAVMTHDLTELLIFVIGLNGLWMVVPGLMIWQSLRQPTEANAIDRRPEGAAAA